MRSIPNTPLTMAWLEYEETGDGAAFTHYCTSRLRIRNAFASLPRAGNSALGRAAANAPSTEFKVCTFQDHGKKPLRGLLGVPAPADNDLFERWVTSPAISGGSLVADPTAGKQVDLLVLSGHGSGGDIWGTATGAEARVSPTHAFIRYENEPRSGRMKCLIAASCNNLNLDAAALWLSAFNHPQPVHVILGYEDRYSGGSFGARALAKFGQLLAENSKTPLVEAWRRANESIRPIQPWAALTPVAGETLNLYDWRRNVFPPLSNEKALLHFNADHPEGQDVQLFDKNYELRWVMDDAGETVIDMENNYPGNSSVGLFVGKRAKIRIRAKLESKNFKKGQELYLLVHKYRDTIEVDISKIFEFDEMYLTPHPYTGKPIVTLEKGRKQRPKNYEGHITDAIRLVVPSDTSTLELGFTIKSSVPDEFDADGPAGSYGRFLLDLFHRYTIVDEYGRRPVSPDPGGRSYAATAGVLLRK